VLFIAQPLVLLVTTVACLWSPAWDRSTALLGAVAGLQVLLVLAGLRSWAVDGGSWRRSLRTPFFDTHRKQRV
jgi:hypothetical protein